MNLNIFIIQFQARKLQKPWKLQRFCSAMFRKKMPIWFLVSRQVPVLHQRRPICRPWDWRRFESWMIPVHAAKPGSFSCLGRSVVIQRQRSLCAESCRTGRTIPARSRSFTAFPQTLMPSRWIPWCCLSRSKCGMRGHDQAATLPNVPYL